MAVKTQAQLLAEVASLLADNTTGDISALDVRTCLNDIIDSASYGGKKVYKALLTQTGTNAPVATVLENTLSGTPVWGYGSAGIYTLTLIGEFTADKTICFLTGSKEDREYNWEYNTIDSLNVRQYQPSSLSYIDSIISLSITIEVYP